LLESGQELLLLLLASLRLVGLHYLLGDLLLVVWQIPHLAVAWLLGRGCNLRPLLLMRVELLHRGLSVVLVVITSWLLVVLLSYGANRMSDGSSHLQSSWSEQPFLLLALNFLNLARCWCQSLCSIDD